MVRVLIICLLLPVSIFAQQLSIENPLRFLALGDSYTIGQSVPASQRWPHQLRDSLAVRGIVTDTLSIIATTGWRTDNLINAITNKGLENKNYNLVSLLIGVNNQFQNRPFSQYVTEFPILLDSAIRYAGGDPSHVFVVSIPDYAFTPFGQQSGNSMEISEEIDQYNAYNRQVAVEKQVVYFDITPISRLGLQIPSYVAGDGLHPSGIQYTEWVKVILEHIDNFMTGTEEDEPINDLRIMLHPNPASDFLTIDLSGTNPTELYDIEIFAPSGQLILRQRMDNTGAIISTNSFPDGIYFVKIRSGRTIALQKFVKQIK